MTCTLVLSGRVELMVMHGGVKNNYEKKVVVMNLPLCPQTADDVNVKSGKACTISFERPVNYLCDAWHVFPPKYKAWTNFNRP